MALEGVSKPANRSLVGTVCGDSGIIVGNSYNKSITNKE